MALFTLEDVKFNSRSGSVVNGISLEIEKGSVTVLVGKSGCGKSTLLKLIAGILVPAGGKVLYNSKDIQMMNSVENRAFRKNCSFVFQDSALWANQDIMSNLSLPLQTHFPAMGKQERLEKIKAVCELINYERALTLRPSDLSMGEQKKIAFARAIICDPEVLFLDECTESLDRKGTARIYSILHDFIDRGNTVIYVSHNSSFISEFPGVMHTIEKGLLSESVYIGDE